MTNIDHAIVSSKADLLRHGLAASDLFCPSLCHRSIRATVLASSKYISSVFADKVTSAEHSSWHAMLPTMYGLLLFSIFFLIN